MPAAVTVTDVPPRARSSNTPAPFAPLLDHRDKRTLGDVFGLASFGVNLTKIGSGGGLALMHGHSLQDEFICVPEDEPVLVTLEDEVQLAPGMCTGFPAGGARPTTCSTDPARHGHPGDRKPVARRPGASFA